MIQSFKILTFPKQLIFQGLLTILIKMIQLTMSVNTRIIF